MGVTFALVAMLCFAANILITRYAVARMPVEAGFLRRAGDQHPVSGAAVPVRAGGARRALGLGLEGRGAVRARRRDRHLPRAGASCSTRCACSGPRARACSTRPRRPSRWSAPGCWRTSASGSYEIALMAIVWVGLWFTQPRAGSARRRFRAGGRAQGNAGRPADGRRLRHRQRAARPRDARLGRGGPRHGAVVAAPRSLCQVVATRDWGKIAAQLRARRPHGAAGSTSAAA